MCSLYLWLLPDVGLFQKKNKNKKHSNSSYLTQKTLSSFWSTVMARKKCHSHLIIMPNMLLVSFSRCWRWQRILKKWLQNERINPLHRIFQFLWIECNSSSVSPVFGNFCVQLDDLYLTLLTLRPDTCEISPLSPVLLLFLLRIHKKCSYFLKFDSHFYFYTHSGIEQCMNGCLDGWLNGFGHEQRQNGTAHIEVVCWGSYNKRAKLCSNPQFSWLSFTLAWKVSISCFGFYGSGGLFP